MKITIAAATTLEIAPTLEWIKIKGLDLSVLITGLGSSIAAHALTRHILTEQPELLIQAGIGGSFTPELPPGSLAFVEREVFADLGAVEQDKLTDIFDLGLTDASEDPFDNRWLVNRGTADWARYGLPFVKSATVNNISSLPEQVSRIRDKYGADLEAMEGAALHYVCLREKIPFIQLRAVSNYAGQRDKSKWKMKEALQALNQQLQIIINDFK